MLKTAELFHVAFSPTAPDAKLKQQLPIWHHLGLENEQICNNGIRETCLWQNHDITTVGDLVAFTTRVQPETHRPSMKCNCETCRLDCIAGCTKPHSCESVAVKLLNKLPKKFDPRSFEGGGPTVQNEITNDSDEGGEDNTTFNPCLITCDNLTDSA